MKSAFSYSRMLKAPKLMLITLGCLLVVGCDTSTGHLSGVNCESTNCDEEVVISENTFVGTYEMTFISPGPGYWAALPQTRWSHTKGVKQQISTGELRIEKDGYFTIVVERLLEIYEYIDRDTPVPRIVESRIDKIEGTYQQFGKYLYFESDQGDIYVGESLQYKLRIYSIIPRMLGFQSDFQAPHELPLDLPVQSGAYQAKLVTDSQGKPLPQFAGCIDAWTCFEMTGGGFGGVSGDFYGLTFEYDGPGWVQDNQISGLMYQAGPALILENPRFPEWPFFGILGDSVLTVYRVPILNDRNFQMPLIFN